MPSPAESRAALEVVTVEAAATVVDLVPRLTGTGEQQRLQLLDTVPAAINYFATGTAALAADFYDEQRALADVTAPFVSELVLVDDTVRIRRAIAWAAEPLVQGVDDAEAIVSSRLAEIVQLDVPRPYRDTILGNRRRDPEAVGYERVVSANACKFCLFMAGRGAIYKKDTAYFAAHANCTCSAAPVFRGGETGPEATVLQYVGTRRRRTPAQRAALRDVLNSQFPDAPG